MAASPKWKVYSADGEYRAAVKYPEDAAALVDFLGEGATIRASHDKRWTVWTEGKDGRASESYDQVASTVADNEDAAAVAAVQRMIRERDKKAQEAGK
jgi:hypothetical protein